MGQISLKLFQFLPQDLQDFNAGLDWQVEESRECIAGGIRTAHEDLKINQAHLFFFTARNIREL